MQTGASDASMGSSLKFWSGQRRGLQVEALPSLTKRDPPGLAGGRGDTKGREVPSGAVGTW